MWDVGVVGCSRCGMFGMCDVRRVGWSVPGIPYQLCTFGGTHQLLLMSIVLA